MLRWACLALLLGAAPVHAASPPGPQTQLLDTATRSAAAWSPVAVAGQTGWEAVEEDELEHRFRGDVVLANDQLAVVLRWQGAGAEVYRRTAAGWKPRAVLSATGPAGSAVAPAGLTSVRTLENNAGAVMVEATIKTAAGQQAALTYRLAAGQMILETRGGAGADKLSIACRPSWVLVPDFFGDDLVFGPTTSDAPRPRMGLPAENFFLGLLDGGDAILMCVWQSSRQEAALVLAGDAAHRHIAGCEIQCAPDKAIWAAFLEGPGLWHSQSVRPPQAGGQTALAWKPPFAAKWRADVVFGHGWAASSYFRGRGEADPADSAARVCLPDQSPAECLLDGDRAVVRVPAARADLTAAARPLVVYPIDRSLTTPLTAFCPIDVLRNTLGVGPCQYILQTEGLTSETNPTPESVAAWVEKQFSRKKEKQAADEMQELLGQMVEHVGRAETRIRRYAELAAALEASLPAPAVGDETLARLREGTRRLATIAAAGTAAPRPSQRATDMATRIPGLIGTSNALAECRRLTAELQAVGGLQDRTLANCRMSVRWLREQAQTAAADPQAGGAARDVHARIEQFLQTK